MGLATLRKHIPANEDENMLDDVDMPPVDDHVPPEPPIFPADLRFCVTVFYDPEVFHSDALFDALQERMEQRYAGREIDMRKLDKSSLVYARLSSFPESEERFLRQGYADNVEGRTFNQGGYTRSSYAKRNIAALTVNAMLLATVLYNHPIAGRNRALGSRERWRNVWRTMAPVTGVQTVHNDERDGLLMAHMQNRPNAAFDHAANRYPLIEHEGLLLGTRNFQVPHSIHWSYDFTPFGAWDAVDDVISHAIFGAAAKDVRKQIKFEARNAQYLFRPELIDTNVAQTQVTAAMIATWYSQVIAAMRKICWLATTEEDPLLAAHTLHQEEAIHGFVLGAGERLPENGRSWEQLIADKTIEFEQLRAQQMPPVVGGQRMTYKISWHDELVGDLMGATYESHDDPSESPYSNPDIFTASLARWIGELKRKRQARLDGWVAQSILSFWRKSRQSEPLVLSQFPEDTWERLVEIAEGMEADREMQDVEVTYTWTRDRNAPYKCAANANVLALEGPLLCFPTLQAVRWQDKARIVRRQIIWRSLGLGLAEYRPRLWVDVMRRACGAASADAGWFVV